MKIHFSQNLSFFYSQMAARSLMWAIADRANWEKRGFRTWRDNMRTNALEWKRFSKLAKEMSEL